jgi:hypothetical protein
MSILARLDLPAFDSDPALATSVRASEEFTEFRRALQSSLLLIEEIAADGSARATDTVGVELQGALARLEKAARKSPSLAAARVGVRGLTFMGVGASKRCKRDGRRSRCGTSLALSDPIAENAEVPSPLDM